jgi:hypothetical protein
MEQSMPKASCTPGAKSIDDVAQLLSRVVDVGPNSNRADELIDEISQLLWMITELDPDAESLLKHSGYVADVAARSFGWDDSAHGPRRE